MNSCTLYNKPIKDDTKGIPNINIGFISRLLSAYNTTDSGIWKPIVVYSQNSRTTFCDPLVQAGLSKINAFDPCNCSSDQISSEGAGFYNDTKIANLDCSYCGNHEITWKLYDTEGGDSVSVLGEGRGLFSADCCGGACDVRFKNDDFLPKIPLLNQTYLSGFYDFKHLEHKFPACSNPPLGFEKFISFTEFGDLSTTNDTSFFIDWTLKETISEIDYEPISSYHINEYTHNKSKNKADLMSKTCGNFILTSVSSTGFKQAYSLFNNVGTSREIPTTGDFTLPYGFENGTYNNLFVGGNKVASHWKWNYTSGILGWYRYYDINRTNDQRPIKGVDLYISDGDVFWATTEGPEKTNPNYFSTSLTNNNSVIKECPSGLKVVDGTTFVGIIPEGSECVYISNNIYPTFYSFYEKYLILGNSHQEAFRLASIMATSPLYDGYTVDLLHPESSELYSRFNEYGQIDTLNKDMLIGTSYGSSRGLNYIQNNNDLINNLYHKYGGYLWIPPNTSTAVSLTLPSDVKSIYCDLDFDIVVDKRDIVRRFRTKPVKNSEVAEEIQYCDTVTGDGLKRFTYNQKIVAGTSFVTNNLDTQYHHQQSCNNGEFDNFDFALYGNLLLNNTIFSSIPVYSGAYILTDIYPRVTLSSNTPAFCNNCGANTSFYLAENAETLCTPPIIDPNNNTRDDSQTFCYDVLANFLNNSEGVDPQTGEPRPDGTRPRRTIVDGTFYDYRRYKSIAFNPHIDLVAFHEHGGVYVNSLPFNTKNAIIFDKNTTNNNPASVSINFDTLDVGIKIYSIYLEKLQSSDTDSFLCKRFPIDLDNICRCYGLNLSRYGSRSASCASNNSSYSSVSLYVPTLSTKNSPPIRYYGGYTVDEVEELFGISVPAKAGNLPIINTKIDPENPYSCYKNSSVSLLNYTTRTYELTLNNFSTDHSDVYVSVNENIDYLGVAATPIYNSFYEIIGFRPNNNWKRFLNKVTLNNNTILYNGQKEILYSAGETINNKVSVQLTNPFLEKIVGDQALIIPTGDQCSVAANSAFIVNGVRGDELSTVNINIIQKPRTQLLTFTINKNSNSTLTTFSKGSFLPHKGLSSITDLAGNARAIDSDGSINYYNILSAQAPDNNDRSFWAKQKLLYATLNETTKNILNDISTFSIHRKPRLYLQNRGRWYTAVLDNKGGFIKNDIAYIGSPKIFEYVRNPVYSQNIGCTIPAVPKKPVSLNIRNYNNFPKAVVLDRHTARIEGSLAYTMIPEQTNIIISEYSDIETHVANATYVSDIVPEPNDCIRIGLNDFFVYIGNNITDLKNYIYIGNDPNILRKKSNLEIDYENISDGGYVYNSYHKCSTINIAIYNQLTKIQETEVVAKKLTVKFYNDQNELVTGDYSGNKKIKIYTELVFKSILKADIGQTISIDLGNYDYIWDELPSNDSDVLLSNNVYNTKWGDLIKYDGYLFNNPYIPKYRSNILPPTPYENLLYKQIINDNSNDYIFKIGDTVFNRSIRFGGLIYEPPLFFLLQKYNAWTEKIWDSDLTKFQNYVPILFISPGSLGSSIETGPGQSTRYIDNQPPWLQPKDTNNQNIFYSSSLMNIYNQNDYLETNPDNAAIFFINDITELEAAFVPDNSKDFYLETLRLDDPMFWLDRTIKEEEVNIPDGARTIFRPNNMNTYTNSFRPANNFVTETIDRNSSFYSQSIYADMDQPAECNQQQLFEREYSNTEPATCIFRSAGTIKLSSRFAIGKPNKITFDQLNDSVVGYIGYEAGLYNPLGNSNAYVSITRTELPLDNPIETETSCSSIRPIPNYKSSIFLSSYQEFIDNNKNNTTHSTEVINTDLHANEMLFRILYGEKQVINRQQLFIDKLPLNKNDLLNYSEPKITPKDIYNEILYNYDQSASQNLNINGSLQIIGTKEIGDSISISIGDVNISLAIIFNGSTKDVLLEGTIGSQAVSVLLYNGNYSEKSLIIQQHFTDEDEPEAPEPSGDNETITLVATTTGQTDDIVVTAPPENPPNNNIISVGVASDWVRIFRTTTTPAPCHPGTKPNDPFKFGYCRVNEDQSNCDTCDKFEGLDIIGDSANFSYEFEDCAYKFNVFGHSYRYHYATTDTTPVIDIPDSTEENPDDLEDGLYGPDPRRNRDGTPVDYPPAGASCPLAEPLHVRGGCMPVTCYGAVSPNGCGSVGVADGRISVRKVYIRSISQEVDPYESSSCPSQLFSLSYTNNKLTANIPNAKAMIDPYTGKVIQSISNKSYCIPLNINNNCPTINVNFSNNKYTITENIDSSCDENCQNDADLEVQSQKIKYNTQDFTAVCVVGIFSYANVNGGNAGPVRTAFRPADCCDDFGGCFAPCLCNTGNLSTLCDGTGAPWRVCENPKILSWGGNHHNYWAYNMRDKGTALECDPFDFGLTAHGPTAAAQAQIFENRLNRMFNRTYVNDTLRINTSAGMAAYFGPMHDCQVRPNIPDEDIFEGVIPGSCTFKKYTSTRDVTKAQLAASGGVRFDTMTITYNVYYVQYKYRTTQTTQSVQTQAFDPITSDEVIEIPPTPFADPNVETNNSVGACKFNSFPDNYRATNIYGFPLFAPNTYIIKSPFYVKGPCEDELTCYNNDDTDTDQQTICDNGDWMCWSVQDLRNSYKFLSRLNNEVWR